MWQLGVSKSQIWSFNMCSVYSQVWKVYQSVVKYSVYLYFNVTLFSSKEGKYNLPSILKGAGKNLVLVFIAISYLKAAQCLCRFFVLCPLQTILQGRLQSGGLVPEKGGWLMDWEWQIQGRRFVSVSSCFSSADCRWICCNLGMDLA